MSFIDIDIFPLNSAIGDVVLYDFDLFQGENIFLLCIWNKNCAFTVYVCGRFALTSTASPWSCSCLEILGNHRFCLMSHILFRLLSRLKL